MYILFLKGQIINIIHSFIRMAINIIKNSLYLLLYYKI